MALKVIGAGLGRTGTMSLKYALERLLGERCYHMSECFTTEHGPPLFLAAAKGRPNWDETFEGFGATVDYPSCTFWRELSAYYPDAKVLLSVRDPDKWFDSTEATIFSDNTEKLFSNPAIKEFFWETVLKDFGDQRHDRAFMTSYFKRRNAEIETAIPKGRLLVFDVAEGWEPLCKFLGVPVPNEPFPRVNTRDELAEALNSAAAGNGAPDMNRMREHARKLNETKKQ